MESECYTDKTKQVGLFFLLLNLLIVFLTSIYKIIINFTLSSFVAGYVLQPFVKINKVKEWGNYLYDKCNKYFTILYDKIPLEYKKQYVKPVDTTVTESTESSTQGMTEMKSMESSDESEISSDE
jgi:hypothetical protein